MPDALRVLVMIAAHPKMWRFVRLCAWSILLLGTKPPLAHYPAFIVCLAITKSMLLLGPKPPLEHYPVFIVCLTTTSFKK
jgi:hypothetical protein